jgi:uncharacterized lipoprotein YmbA
MKLRPALWIIAGSALITLAACMPLGTTTTTRFYLLEATAPNAAPAGAAHPFSHLSFGVGPVSIPSYLDRPQIVRRRDAHELKVNEFDQWAEPIGSAITRVMADNLAAATGAAGVYPHPWDRSAAIDMRIPIDIRRFDAAADGRVTLSAVWRIVDGGGRRRLLERETTVTRSPEGTEIAQLVAAMNAALADLSAAIAAALADLPPPAPPDS